MKFIMLYKGPATPAGASHKGWMTFFASLGDALVSIGSPMAKGVSLHNDDSMTDSNVDLNGYGIIRAKTKEAAAELIKDHPYRKLGPEYTIELFQIR